MNALGRLWTRGLDLLYPRKCAVCQRLLKKDEPLLCPECREKRPVPVSVERRGAFYRTCVCSVRYDGEWRRSVQRFKFGGCPFYAEAYGALLADTIREKLAGRYDIISWVPLSRQRRRERGYDQAYLLALEAGKALGEPPIPTLVRIKHRKPMSSIPNAAQRRANIRGAYRVTDAETVRDRRVLLIDDIHTTGATLSEAAKTLLMAGASSVVCACLAKAEH